MHVFYPDALALFPDSPVVKDHVERGETDPYYHSISRPVLEDRLRRRFDEN